MERAGLPKVPKGGRPDVAGWAGTVKRSGLPDIAPGRPLRTKGTLLNYR